MLRMKQQKIAKLKAKRDRLMRKRNELVRELRVRREAWHELAEVCRQVWKMHRALGLLPPITTPAEAEASPVEAPSEIAA